MMQLVYVELKMSESVTLTGPDLLRGVAADQLREAQPLLGHAGGVAVMLVREGGRIHATAATCTHYGGPLAEGLVADGTVRCPWHHACFDLQTGESVRAPALTPIDCFEVLCEGSLVRVGNKRERNIRTPVSAGPTSVAIVGAGPAGTACAETLRSEGYRGPVTLVGAELPGPVDRPNLSKDYLAGTAPEEWIPLRTAEALREHDIELIANDPATLITLSSQKVQLASGRLLDCGALVLATGAEAIRLAIEGSTLPHVHLLRTLADARGIIGQVGSAKRAAIIGSSFVGLEAAASLRKLGLEVSVIGRDSVPLERALGREVGLFVQRVHEKNGVVFRQGSRPTRITESEVTLSDGSSILADLVVMGVGVRPRTALAQAAGLRVEDGIVVDEQLRTSMPNVYAAGDAARYPYDGALVRIEHFAVAERHGQEIARTIVGRTTPHRAVPFFWSQHYDITLSYVGHAEHIETARVNGDLAKLDASVVYRDEGRVRAVLTIGRDRLALEVERAMEMGDRGTLEALVG
jgi:NADPH-dependent 2,4-dienoyl-CoA reductase/sulfur reductase-like enzyme/nitrite reductase/ring-hydroxylating ferredoxin subunit